MRIAKGCLWAALSLLLASGLTARAAAVAYSLSSGQVTAVTLDFDQTNRLAAPVSLDAGQVSVDFSALVLDILAVSTAGPGLVQLGGINGWDSVTFTNASFESLQVTNLTGGVGGVYNYGVPVQVIADLQLQPGNVVFNDFSPTSAATGSIIALNGNQTVDITVNGVVLGSLQDPVHTDAAPVLVKADFHFVAGLQGQAPEPALGSLALLGLAALALRRHFA
jgi:hypothetical protein